MVTATPLTPPSNSQQAEAEAEAENLSVPELFSALRRASQADEFARIEEALAAREAKLKQEIERQRHEKALMEENHEFERLEKLKAEDELRLKLSAVKVEAVSGEELPENDEDNEVVSERPGEKLRRTKRRKGLSESDGMQRRRSERLAAIATDSAADNSASDEENGGLTISGYRGDERKPKKWKNMGKLMEKRKTGSGGKYIQYRCTMMSFFNTMKRVKKHLKEGHLKLLQQTPFWPLISPFYNGVISEDQCRKPVSGIRNIIKCYNSTTMSFEFGSTSARMTTEDIAEILGLPLEGEEVQLKGSTRYRSDFTNRYFDVKEVSKKMVDDALEEAIKGKREIDVVRLIVLVLCVSFLFSGTTHFTSWNIVKYCEDFENISRYSWAKAVADLLHKSLQASTMRFDGCTVHGCVVAIMIWLCEKTNLIQPISGREGQKPALVKWSLQELHMKLQEIDIADVGLSFKKDKGKKKKRGENKTTGEEAKTNGREDREQGEDVFELETCSSQFEQRSKKLRKGNNLQRRSERLTANRSAANNSSSVSSLPVKGNKDLGISGYIGVTKKQMENRKTQKRKMRTWTSAEGGKHVQYRCNMKSFFNTMQRVKKHLTEGHLELLRQTPFWPLISAFYYGVISEDQCRKSDSDVLKIIRCYNSITMSFEFGSTSALLTTEDIAKILGLPQEGGLNSWSLVKYCEDLENISRYSWAKAVADLLHESLGKRTKMSDGYSHPGCVVVIMLWLCERTNLIRPIKGREGQRPALVKWNLQELHSKLEQIDVADIGLSFKDKEKKKKRKYNGKTHEEAEIDGQEDGEEGEDVFRDTVGSSEDKLRVQKTQSQFIPAPTISKMVQKANAEVSRAQRKVDRLTGRLESKKEKTIKLRRKLKEEKEEKRKLKEDYEFVIAEQKSLFGSLKGLVKKLEGTLEAEREEVKNLKKEKTELIKENQELKDQLHQGSPCTAMQLREDVQIVTSTVKRALEPEFGDDQGGKKKRKGDEQNETRVHVLSDATAAGILG
ncbi:hypothetical protein ACFX1Q_038213 [Malus domestica]